jgi:hypothetical protein
MGYGMLTQSQHTKQRTASSSRSHLAKKSVIKAGLTEMSTEANSARKIVTDAEARRNHLFRALVGRSNQGGTHFRVDGRLQAFLGTTAVPLLTVVAGDETVSFSLPFAVGTHCGRG